MVADVGFDAGGAQGLADGLGAVGNAAGGFADGGADFGVLIFDDAGLEDVGGEPGGAADDVLRAENGCQGCHAVDAVLEGDDGGLIVQGGSKELGGGLGVVALDGEDDEVELGVGFFRAFDGIDAVDVAGSGFADHAEAVVADGLEVGAAGDEGDVVASLEKAGANEAANAAGTHDQDLHWNSIRSVDLGLIVACGRVGFTLLRFPISRCCVTGGWAPGIPLTDFGRRRRNPGSGPGQAGAGSASPPGETFAKP